MGHLSLPFSEVSLRYVVSSLVNLLEFVTMNQCVIVAEVRWGGVLLWGIHHTDVQLHYTYNMLLAVLRM